MGRSSLDYDSNINSNSFEHYGVLGMKWGVRKGLDKEGKKAYRKDAQARRIAARKVSASRANLKSAARENAASENRLQNANKQLTKANRSIFRRTAKRNAAYANIDKAMDDSIQTRANKRRAETIFDNDVAEFKKATNKLLKRYGDKATKKLTSQDMQLADGFIKRILKTPFTVGNMPILGRKYRGNHITDSEYAYNRKKSEKVVKKVYRH